MKKLLLLVLGCGSLLLACGGHGGIPEHPVMPIRAVGEDVDEWAYAHCDVKKVVKLDNGDIEPAAQSAGSNFVEIIYQEPGASAVVMFACREKIELADEVNEKGMHERNAHSVRMDVQ
jgi:hypothetical protein